MDHTRFETSSEAPAPDSGAFPPDDPVLRGNRRRFLRDRAGAIRDWEEALRREGSSGTVRFALAKAWREAGRTEKAEEIEGDLVRDARALRPGDLEEVGGIPRFDPAAEVLPERLRKARGE